MASFVHFWNARGWKLNTCPVFSFGKWPVPVAGLLRNAAACELLLLLTGGELNPN